MNTAKPIAPAQGENPLADEVVLARTGVTDIFGKLDDDLPPVRMNGDVMDDIRRSARAAGCSLSEYVRNMLYIGVYGFEHINSLREAQLRRVMVNAAHTVGNGAGK